MLRTKLLFIILIVSLAACSQKPGKEVMPTITVSILPQKYFTERIAGENFKINVLVPRGSSPETYEPTPRQMQDVANSLLYFRIGYIEFERTVLNNIRQQNSDVKFVNTSEGMDMIAAEIVDHGDHVHLYGVDPHTWMTIPGVKIQLENMLAAIIETDPGNEDYYLDNYNKFLEELNSLHENFKDKFSSSHGNTFLIFHPVLGYFARDYQLTQLAIEQDGKSPSPANMKQVIDLAGKENIKTVFIQMEFERDNAVAIAREIGGEVVEIDPLGENWMESMKDIADKLYEALSKMQIQ